MRVALIHSFFYSASGAAEVVLNAAGELKGRGHAVSVFTLCASREVADEFLRRGIHLESVGFREWRTNGITVLSALDPLLLLINKVRAFFVLSNLAGRIDEMGDVALTSHYHLTPLLHLLLKKPVVYYCHEPPRQYYEPLYGGGRAYRSLAWKLTHPLDALYGFVDKGLDRLCVRKASKIAANSDYTRDYVKRIYGMDAERIHPGVDAKFFRNLNLKRSCILSVGRLYMDLKGHRFVVRSLGLVSGEKPQLVVVGDGTDEEKEELRRLAGACGVSLEIKANVGREELVGLYNRARVCVFGYVREPFGLTVVEALACGAPVVAVAEGGIPEIVAEGVGLLVPRDEGKFAEALEFMLRNPAEALKMGAASRRRVESYFTWERFGLELEDVLSEVAVKSPRR
jgi:glycosyltransferase involved in cell wall biosynthesis